MPLVTQMWMNLKSLLIPGFRVGNQIPHSMQQYFMWPTLFACPRLNKCISFFWIHQQQPFQYQISIKFPNIKAQSNENSSTYHEPNPKINTRGKKTIWTVSGYRSTSEEYSLFVRLVASGQSDSGKNRPNLCNLPSTAGHAVSLQYTL
jgi:hypothetical protein